MMNYQMKIRKTYEETFMDEHGELPAAIASVGIKYMGI